MNNEGSAQPVKATLKGHGNPTELIWFGNGAKPKTEGMRVTVESRGEKFNLLDSDGDAGPYFGSHKDDRRILGLASKFWACKA